MSFYKMRISEIYHIAKYLLKEEEKIETLILDFLENIRNLYSERDIATMAGNIIDNWFDNNKRLGQIIPSTFLK